jgi:hypothetical protein
LTCFYQAVLVLVWFRKGEDKTTLGAAPPRKLPVTYAVFSQRRASWESANSPGLVEDGEGRRPPHGAFAGDGLDVHPTVATDVEPAGRRQRSLPC